MILLIDNYDSFSYNLVQFFGTLCLENTGPLTPHRSGECTGTEPAVTEAAGPEAAEPEIAGTKPDIRVIRNDAMTPEEIRNLHPDHIILSPGPGYPKNAGVCEDVVRQMKGEVPILGVCLGHQGICEVFGAEIVHAAKLMHGKQSTITIDNSDLIFQGLPEKIPAARYHSRRQTQFSPRYLKNNRRGRYGRDHGSPSYRLSGLRPPIPSGIDSDPRRHDNTSEFP